MVPVVLPLPITLALIVSMFSRAALLDIKPVVTPLVDSDVTCAVTRSDGSMSTTDSVPLELSVVLVSFNALESLSPGSTVTFGASFTEAIVMFRVCVLLLRPPSLTEKLTVRVAVFGSSLEFVYCTLRRAAWY